MTEYLCTESADYADAWDDPEGHRVIVADSASQAAERYCERADPAWWLDKRRGDPVHVRRVTVYVRTPIGEVWRVPIVAGVERWSYREDTQRPKRRVLK